MQIHKDHQDICWVEAFPRGYVAAGEEGDLDYRGQPTLVWASRDPRSCRRQAPPEGWERDLRYQRLGDRWTARGTSGTLHV